MTYTWTTSLRYLLSNPRIRKLNESCGKEWEAHWQCLERNNQVSHATGVLYEALRAWSWRTGSAWGKHLLNTPRSSLPQELYLCRKPEKTFNDCVFSKLVSRESYTG
jgi:NADH dehydrogenase (ubiquinone) 1 alpha subcomplex subunit 8